jgi:EmrB/QacA subfamily drug resistance transporter
VTLDIPVRPPSSVGPRFPARASTRSSPGSSRVSPNALLALMCVALGLVIAANSSLSVAQPDIARALGASQTELTWVVNSYAMVFAALLLPAGIAADKYGRRTALLIGLLVFGVANLISGFAGDATTLILLRAVAGLGATLVMPATLAVLVDSFPAERRSFAVSVWAGVAGAGALLGILLTGLLLNNFWWGSVQVLFGIGSLALMPAIAYVVPNTRDPTLPLDVPGGVWVALGLGGLVFGLIEGPDQGWDAATTLTGLVGGTVALAVFVLVELRSPAPMLDVRLFRSRGLAAGSLLVMLLSVAVFGFFLIGPQFLQFINGYDTLGAAVRLLPFAIGIVPGSQLSPLLVQRLGARWVSASGAALMGAGMLILGASADHGYGMFVAGLVVTSFGMGLALSAGTTLIIDGLPADRRTLSSAVNDVTREIGSAVGAAAFGSLLLTVYRGHVEPALGGIPADAADTVRDGMSGALAVAPGTWPASRALVPAATIGFTEGFQASMQIGAAILFGTAVLVAVLAPGVTRVLAVPAAAPPAGPRASGTDGPGPRRKLRTRVALAIGLVVVLSSAGVIGGRYLSDARAFISTDNAQIDGNRISITAPISGTLVRWRATRGTQLSRDMPVGRIQTEGGFGQPQLVIRSPGDGVVGLDLATEGSHVSVGTQLATAYDLDGIYVTARIEEGDIGDVAVGGRVEMTVDAYPDVELTGSVASVQAGTAGVLAPFVPANTTGDFVEVTQLIAVRIALDDTRNLDLVPGMNVAVTMRRS